MLLETTTYEALVLLLQTPFSLTDSNKYAIFNKNFEYLT